MQVHALALWLLILYLKCPPTSWMEIILSPQVYSPSKIFKTVKNPQEQWLQQASKT